MAFCHNNLNMKYKKKALSHRKVSKRFRLHLLVKSRINRENNKKCLLNIIIFYEVVFLKRGNFTRSRSIVVTLILLIRFDGRNFQGKSTLDEEYFQGQTLRQNQVQSPLQLSNCHS